MPAADKKMPGEEGTGRRKEREVRGTTWVSLLSFFLVVQFLTFLVFNIPTIFRLSSVLVDFFIFLHARPASGMFFIYSSGVGSQPPW